MTQYTTKDKADLAPKSLLQIKELRTTLIHHAIYEYVVTRRPSQYGLYPLLSFISLLLQKPVLMVVFNKPVNQVNVDQSDNCGWAHTFTYPDKLKTKFDKQVRDWLTKHDSTKHDWIFEYEWSEHEKPPENPPKITALGIFYLNLEYEQGRNYIEDEREEWAGQALSLESNITTLSKIDQTLVRKLFLSIIGHTEEQGRNRSHLRNVTQYCDKAIDAGTRLFKRTPNHNEQSTETIDQDLRQVSADDIVKILAPMIDEIDTIYRELRGGTAGEFENDHDKSDRETSLLWNRHNASVRNGTGCRPPTIAFYVMLKNPIMKNIGVKRTDIEHGYRIVPIVTPSIARDAAATLIDYINHGKDLETINTRIREVEGYLKQLGATETKKDDLSNLDTLSRTISDICSIKNYLGKQYSHSMTYPAFSSGVTMFTEAYPCSKVDRMCYGPDFLEEVKDTAFTKITTVSGFPFVGIVTRSHGEIDQHINNKFSYFYYNYLFEMGITHRWCARRLRFSAERVLYERIEYAMCKVLLAPDVERLFRPEVHEFSIGVPEGWPDRINSELDLIAQVLPFGKIITSIDPKDMIVHNSDMGRVVIFERTLYFWLEGNKYFHDRKLINNDTVFLSNDKLKRYFERGAQKVLHQLGWEIRQKYKRMDT